MLPMAGSRTPFYLFICAALILLPARAFSVPGDEEHLAAQGHFHPLDPREMDAVAARGLPAVGAVFAAATVPGAEKVILWDEGPSEGTRRVACPANARK